MQSIIDKYPKDTRYLLPILTNDADDRQTYKKLSKRINRHLRQVGEMAELPIPLTLYVARHSWASIAKQKQIPISVISDALGHDSEKTTLIYLSTLDCLRHFTYAALSETTLFKSIFCCLSNCLVTDI